MSNYFYIFFFHFHGFCVFDESKNIKICEVIIDIAEQ